MLQVPAPKRPKAMEKVSPVRRGCSQVTSGHTKTTQDFSEMPRRALKV